MSGKSTDPYQIAVNRFWCHYLSLLEKNSVPKHSQSWYRKHVQIHLAFARKIRIRQTGDRIEYFVFNFEKLSDRSGCI